MISQVEATVRELAHSPLLPFVQRRLDRFMADEQARRDAFQRAVDAGDPRYDGKKVEFINGTIIEAMPTAMRHWQVGQYLLRLVQTFIDVKRLGAVGYEKLMISLARNDYEPDVCFWSAARAASFTPRQTRFPAPDFIVEILSPSTEQIDREIKLRDYAAHGVTEYWIVDPERQCVEQYALRDDEYALAATLSDGTLVSLAVSGFQIPVRALFDADANLAALQEILAHAR